MHQQLDLRLPAATEASLSASTVVGGSRSNRRRSTSRTPCGTSWTATSAPSPASRWALSTR
ncbi:hypothetical protein ACFQ1I_35350 [Kitasatospora arboriphila]